MHFNPILVWFLCGLALILFELVAPGIILVFFGLGAWVTTVTTWAGLTTGLTSQLLVFAASSLVLLVLLRRWFRQRFFGYVGGDQDPSRNLDDLAGREVVVTAAIAPGAPGRVEFQGTGWSARADVELAVGAPAVIERADGITLVVHPRP